MNADFVQLWVESKAISALSENILFKLTLCSHPVTLVLQESSEQRGRKQAWIGKSFTELLLCQEEEVKGQC